MFSQMLFNRLLIEFFGRPFNDFKGTHRAFSQTGTQSVTINLCNHAGLAIDDFESAFGTGRHTVAAAVAEFFVNCLSCLIDMIFARLGFANLSRPGGTAPASFQAIRRIITKF